MIQLFTSTLECKEYLKDKSDIGLVPTMGNLHDGHLSLLRTSIKNHKINIITIFVNPTQFAQGEDFNEYPRTLEEDISKIKMLDNVETKIVIFAPASPSEIYPHELSLLKATGPTQSMEGALRPDHFDGVVTVVKRLFDITNPKTAYFGKKDYQQYKVIESMVKTQSLPVRIVGLPTLRDENGLALSSRNNYLSKKEKLDALYLYKSLVQIKNAILARSSYMDVQNQIKELLTDNRFNYIEVCKQDDLSQVDELKGEIVILGNMKIGEIKILDNIEVSIS